MCSTAQHFTQIIDYGTNISAFRAVYFHLHFITFKAMQLNLIHSDLTRFTRHFDTLTGVFVEWTTLVFQR
ncbi:Uncharacterised protein [Vibrio cholerae]|uniref:Uncharacterized protein n=1 Tax=Vibrio cholerae TaxID=666 RepID=A0A655YDP9_VIBCL|nr:Uncharacterised protein [Vibrio cholerae]